MSNAPDPVRWIEQEESLPEAVREGFASYADLGPSEAQRARMLARVTATEPSNAAPSSGWKKIWIASVIAAGLALWSLRAWLTSVPDDMHARDASPAARPAPDVTVVEEPSVGPQRFGTAEEEAREAHAPSTVPSPSTKPVMNRPTEKAALGGVHKAPRTDEGRATASPPAQSPAEELALLTRARSLLATAAEDAWALAEEHRARFPHGTFMEERELIAVEALVRLGRAPAAQARGEDFLARHARSAHAERMRVILQSLASEGAPPR